MKVYTDIHVHHRMKPTASGDPLTFHLVPSVGRGSHLCSEISKYLQDKLELNYNYQIWNLVNQTWLVES